MFIHIKRHVFYFTLEPAIAKKQIFDEVRAQLMENTTNDRPEIMEGINATDNQHSLFFLEFIAVSSYFKITKENIIMQILKNRMHKI